MKGSDRVQTFLTVEDGSYSNHQKTPEVGAVNGRIFNIEHNPCFIDSASQSKCDFSRAFKLENPHQKKLHDIWTSEAPLSRDMTEVLRSHLKKIASIVPPPFSDDYFPWNGPYDLCKKSTGVS